MKLKTTIFFVFSFFLVVTFILEISYLNFQSNENEKCKIINNKELQLTSLPNIAFWGTDTILRHKSYQNIFDLFPYDGELHTNSKMSFVY